MKRTLYDVPVNLQPLLKAAKELDKTSQMALCVKWEREAAEHEQQGLEKPASAGHRVQLAAIYELMASKLKQHLLGTQEL